jgi:AhpC/TSA family
LSILEQPFFGRFNLIGPGSSQVLRGGKAHLDGRYLADFEPKGEVARKYRAYRTSESVCHRALFVLDRQGTIAWS